MDIQTLVSRLNGEFLANKARARVDGTIVILARLNDQTWEYTDEGKRLADEQSNLAVAEASAPAKTPRKQAAAKVESVEPEAAAPDAAPDSEAAQ